MTKGKQVFVKGRIQRRESDKDGEKNYRKEIIADTVTMTGPPAGARREAPLRSDAPRRPSRAERLAQGNEPEGVPTDEPVGMTPDSPDYDTGIDPSDDDTPPMPSDDDSEIPF